MLSARGPVCGYTGRTNRDQKNHVFRCGRCGYSGNDDRIAAMNLQRMGMQYLPEIPVSEKDTDRQEHASAGGALSIVPRCAVSLLPGRQDQVSDYPRWEESDDTPSYHRTGTNPRLSVVSD